MTSTTGTLITNYYTLQEVGRGAFYKHGRLDGCFGFLFYGSHPPAPPPPYPPPYSTPFVYLCTFSACRTVGIGRQFSSSSDEEENKKKKKMKMKHPKEQTRATTRMRKNESKKKIENQMAAV